MPIYLKFGNIIGKSKGKYKHWIELTSCQFGSGRSVQSNAGISRPSQFLTEIVVTKQQDISSTDLFHRSLYGEGVKAEVEFTKEDVTYMHLDLEDALISSYSVSGHGGSLFGGPLESLTINFKSLALSFGAVR